MEGYKRDLIRQKIVDALAAPIPAFCRRDVHIPVIHGKACAVIGMRRAGKTTLLWQLLADRLAQGVGREGLLYFSFEDERLMDLRASDMNLIVEEYYRLNPGWRDQKMATFFFDEIQLVPGWETFVRRLLDSEQVELFLSGSSAHMLSREVATSMRGRAMEVRVYPFSFREYLRRSGQEPDVEPQRLPKAARSAVEKHLREYLLEGGFPEAFGLSARDRSELLRSYVDVALLRDVIERHAVSHPVAMRWMVRQLLCNAAGAFSVNKFYADLKSQGIPVAKDTLHDYLAYLEDAFLIRTISIATESERRRMVNPRKAYPIDPGLIPIFDRSGRMNLGHALETCVLLELERRGVDVAYVRTAGGYEVDFLASQPGGGMHLIQVCTDLATPATRDREIRALIEAAREHPGASLHLITLEPAPAQSFPANISLHLASDWLLAGETN